MVNYGGEVRGTVLRLCSLKSRQSPSVGLLVMALIKALGAGVWNHIHFPQPLSGGENAVLAPAIRGMLGTAGWEKAGLVSLNAEAEVWTMAFSQDWVCGTSI